MFKMDHNPKPLNSDSICMKENFNINVTEPCQEYIYDNTYFDETLSIKFDLVCDNEHYRYVLDLLPCPSIGPKELWTDANWFGPVQIFLNQTKNVFSLTI